jgi:hypothetical protein
MMAWMRDFPPIEPSPLFLQQVTKRVDHLRKGSAVLLFRRLVGALPMQVAAAVALVASAAVLWQATPHIWRGQQARPPVWVEPWSSQEQTMAPVVDAPSYEPLFEEALPAPVPLVQAPLRRPVLAGREEPLRMVRDVSTMPTWPGQAPEGRTAELTLFPSFVLRAADPVQTAQQVWEIVPHLGGALLYAQGMATPAGRAARGPVKVTFVMAANGYQALLDAIRRLPNTSMVEERVAFIGRELSPGSAGAFQRLDYAQGATPPPMTSAIIILPR